LGDAQLSCHDNDDPTSGKAKQLLQDAELSYRASIEQEGCPSVGGEASAKLTEQQWFKERKAKQEAEKKEAVGGTPQKAAAAPAAKGASPAGRGSAQAARGRKASRQTDSLYFNTVKIKALQLVGSCKIIIIIKN